MKKAARILCLLLTLVLCLTLTGPCFAEDNYDTLADWNIRIKVPEETTAVLRGSSYYIYAGATGAIPYVMLTTYRYDSVDKFVTDFTAYMQKQYADLTVTAPAAEKTVGDKDCVEIDYGYTVSGYEVRDRRLVIKEGELVYLFCSKEIDALGRTVGTMLEDVVADCEFLTESGSELPGLEDEDDIALSYVYCQKDGMPKYWLDLTGVMSDSIVLHCYFRSGDPSYYESVYYLSLDDADIGDGRITVYTVFDETGEDVSEFFRQLVIRLYKDGAELTVKRDEKTLAGGADDNILTGKYKMSPAGAGMIYAYCQDDGLRKYWLDSDGENFILHAMFRSGDPEYYEELFTLDVDSAEEENDHTLRIRKVFNEAGVEVSDWFESLTLTEVEGAILMNVERDEKTLAGGADDNILTGLYLLEPRTYLLPADGGPFTEEELAQWAQFYYFREKGFFPPQADVEKNADGSFTIHLYEIVKLDGVSHTATSAWYTVDAYGDGTEDITGRAVSLCG